MNDEAHSPDLKEREVARSLAQTLRLALLRLAGGRGGEDPVRDVLEELAQEPPRRTAASARPRSARCSPIS
jgi:hypothetical protein